MRVGKADGEVWLRLSEAAAALGVSSNTLRRWSDSGRLRVYRSPGGHRRYRRVDVENLLRIEVDEAPVGARRDRAGTDAFAAIDRLQAPLQALAQVAAEGIGVSSCRFVLVDEPDGLRVAAGYGQVDAPTGAADGPPIEAAEPAVAKAAHSSRRILIADLDSTRLLSPAEAEVYRRRGARALLALPVTLGTQLLGALELTETRGARSFTGADVAFAEFVARQAATLIAVESGASPVAAGERAPLPTAAGATLQPGHSARDAHAVLHDIVAQLREEAKAVACDVLSFDRRARELLVVASADASDDAPPLDGLSFPVDDESDIARALRGELDRAVLRPSSPGGPLSGGDGKLVATHLVRYERSAARGIVWRPLRAAGETIGLLELFTADPSLELDPSQHAAVDAGAAVAALALAGEGQLSALTRRLADLDELIAGFAVRSPASDAHELARAALRALLRDTGAATAAVYRFAGGVATKTVVVGGTSAMAPPDGWTLADYPSVAQAVAGGEAVVVTSAGGEAAVADERFLRARGLTGAVITPLVYLGQTVGLLEIGSDDADLDALRALSSATAMLLAVTLGSGDVMAQLQRRNRDLGLVIEAGLEDTARLSTDEVLHSVSKRLAELTGTPVADIYSVEGGTMRALVSYDGGRFDEEWEGVVIPLPRYPCSLRAVETGDIASVSSLDDPLLGAEGRYSLEKWGYQSQLSVPLVSAGRVLGIVELSDYVPRDFTPDFELIKGLAQVAAHALENAGLFEQIARRSGILNELVDLGALASRSRDPGDLVRGFAERLLAIVDAGSCDIFQVCDEGLRCVVSYDRSGFDEVPVGRLLELDNYPTVVTAMNAHQVIVISGPDDLQLTERERRTYREYGFASEVCVPLVAGDVLYGVIDLYDTRERDYTEYLSFLRSAGQTLAGALESSLLFSQIERRNAALRQIVELGALTAQTHDLQAILGEVAGRLRDTIQAADCDIFALQGDRLRCLVSADQDGLDEHVVGHELDVDKFPATAMAIRSGEPMAVTGLDDPRLTAGERKDMGEYGYQSEFCIPLVSGERVIGLIDVFDTEPRDYGEYFDFIMSVGQMAAGAIENARLVEELERGNTTLQTMIESGIDFSASLDLAEVLESVARRLCALTGAPNCDIYTVEGDDYRCVACLDHGEPDPEYVGTTYRTAELELVREVLRTRAPIMIADLATDTRISEFERAEDLRWGHRCRLELPLISRGTVIGIATLFDDHPREFAGVGLLHSLAQAAANALANATLFERLDRSAERTALLSDVSFELTSSLELAQVLRSAALRLCAVSGFPVCDVYRLRDDILVNVASVEDGQPDDEWSGRAVPLSAWTSLQSAVTTRRPLYITALDDPAFSPEERRLMEEYGQTADLVIPLVSRERVIGVLELLDKGPPRALSDEELATIVAVSRVAALAIDNADLVQDLQARSRENELLNEIARATGSSLNLSDIAAAALEKLHQLTPFERAMVALARDETTLEIAYVTPPRREALPPTLALPPMQDLLKQLHDERVVVLSLPDGLPAGFTLPGVEELRSAAVILLRSGDEDIGVLTLGATEDGAFAAVDRRLLERVATHLALAINNARLYEGIKRMHLSNLKALSSALNAKDYYTLGHAARVAAYMVLLGEELGWPAELIRHVEEAAYLHDIGKIGVSDRVLLKPSGLNALEWELMRQHPIFSADIIKPLFDEELVLGVRHHHERYAGGGYPDGLSGTDIPLIARAMCVADSYDAMSFRRPYRQAHTYPQCLEELARCSHSQFDPEIVAAFTRVLKRIADGRARAAAVAGEAAARVDAAKHALLRGPEDESRTEYAVIVAGLREVCRAHPPTSFISSHVRVGKKTTLVAGSGPNGDERPHIGDVVYSDDELLALFDGRRLDANVLFVDQRGVWISGVAPLRDADGSVVAVVSADMPATEGNTGVEGLRSNVAQTFAAMLDTAAAQAGRSELEAITDGLTGLYNHRYFHERLNEEVERAVDSGMELALLFCDLDDFRAFNELHGHSGGDRALRAVARIIEGSVRHVDLAARYGGEEFAAILIDTGERGALEVAERIRSGILEADLAAGPAPLSVSIGVATCPADATFKEELIDKADWAMYLAKRRGRNKVMTFGAQHGSDTPEQAATVGSDYVTTMSELVAAREAYERRRRSAVAHLALAVGRELGLGEAELRAVAGATGAPPAPGAGDEPQRIVALASAYQAMVAERKYRPQLSEAEALEELLNCPALLYDRRLAAAFQRVLADPHNA